MPSSPFRCAPWWAGLVLIFSVALSAPARAEEPFAADVVVIVDTSTSMREPGRDPERTSLLVTQLLADIVPGELAVIRLLDLASDREILPSEPTGVREPCDEDPSRQCDVVAPATDWQEDARAHRLGALARPHLGDDDFARALEGHLEQRINNSMFVLAFRAAQGVFEQHLAAGRNLPRTVIWLSDGRSEEPQEVLGALHDLAAMEVGVEAIVFGEGTTALAQRAGLAARRAVGPAELMKAFAGAFRRIVEAPYEIDARLAEQSSFAMQPAVEEAWVVVYGDDRLGEVWITAPGGERHAADHARRRLAGAGAYRVAHFRKPAAGIYDVGAEGGAGSAAYAVVQRSSLRPRLVSPEEAVSGAETTLVVEVVAGEAGEPVDDDGLLQNARITLEGPRIGTLALERRDDGRFAGVGRFTSSGEARLEIRLESPVVESQVMARLPVAGSFIPAREAVLVDLGSIGLGEQRCRPVILGAEHEGDVPLLAEALRRPPAEHELLLHATSAEEPGGAKPWPFGEHRRTAPGDSLEICLRVGERAPSSMAEGEPWLKIGVPGVPEKSVLELRWRVEGLGFWARWSWLFFTLLAVLLGIAVLLGFLLPHRFSPSLALVFVDDRGEIDEQQPQPVKQWKGVGIGFYRNARAHLHSSFRISGKSKGALATLVAESRGALAMPGKGAALWRETQAGDWETVAAEGRRVRGGDVYRVGDAGPFFRVSVRGSRDG